MTIQSDKRQRSAAIYTLGCRLNRADSDLLADVLRRAGFRILPWGEAADLLVINGCVVTGKAGQKTRRAVRAARSRNPGAFLVLAGCAGEPAAGTDLRELPVDLVLPNSVKTAISAYLPADLRSVQGSPAVVAGAERGEGFSEAATAFPRGRTRANLKIQEGCDFCCSYCIVPQLRGAPRSRSRADVLREAEALLEVGVRELVLTGVHTSLYQSSEGGLCELIDAILALGGGFRIRASSLEPGPEIDPLIERMASEPRICPFLHLPVQHADDAVLVRMGRRSGFAAFATLLEKAAGAVPGICLGTDVIVGFPGEDEAAFQTCLQRLEDLPLGLMHVFPFSPRPGTPAAGFSGRPPAELVRERRQAMLALAARKAESFVQSQLGACAEVLTEEPPDAQRAQGWSGNYLRVQFSTGSNAANQLVGVRLERAAGQRSVEGRVVPVDKADRRTMVRSAST